MMTADQYRAKFETLAAKANQNGLFRADASSAFSQAAAVYGYLYIEKSRFEKLDVKPSEDAESWRLKAESQLVYAVNQALLQPGASAAFSMIANNYAYLWAEQVHVDNAVA